MKKKLLVLALLFSQLSFFAQEYETIVDVTKQWNVVHTMIAVNSPPWENTSSSTYVYTLGNIHEIGSFSYYEVLMNGGATYTYIREDAQHKVYFIGESGEEYLLYDFDLGVGDTFDGEYYEGGWTVTAVETVFYAGANRKKITLDGIDPDIWYEGIGSEKGLTFSGSECIDCYTYLLCYSKDDEILLGTEGNCNYSSHPNYDISFFNEHYFIFDHFLLNEETVEAAAGMSNASFSSNMLGTPEHFETTYYGLCANATSGFVFLNDNNTFTVESRGATTLAMCGDGYPLGDAQEGRYFNILTGYIDNLPNDPLPVHYQKLEGGNVLHMWTDENEKLVFNTYALGVDDVSMKQKFSFYPNPVSSVLTIDTSLSDYHVEIFNLLGKEILTKQVISSSTQLDLSSLTNGVYFVTITTRGESFTIKLVKE